jgi:hypothetical protein
MSDSSDFQWVSGISGITNSIIQNVMSGRQQEAELNQKARADELARQDWLFKRMVEESAWRQEQDRKRRMARAFANARNPGSNTMTRADTAGGLIVPTVFTGGG